MADVKTAQRGFVPDGKMELFQEYESENMQMYSDKAMIRRHIIFYGWVQGVGFRYRARHAAELYGCTGWCRNNWDGSVTMEIQGTEEQIDQVILAIEAGRFVKIENMDSRTIPLVDREYGFRSE